MDKDLKDPTKIKTAFFSRIINTLFLFEKMTVTITKNWKKKFC